MKWGYETLKVAATGFVGGKLDEDTFTAHLNDLGDQGWELVTVFGTNQGGGTTRNIVAVFKRPKERFCFPTAHEPAATHSRRRLLSRHFADRKPPRHAPNRRIAPEFTIAE